MGQKIHPTGFRLAVSRNWNSKWFATSKNFPQMLKEDIDVREYLKKKLAHASVGRVVIERPAKNARVTVYSARPGVVIGKKGEDIETLKADLQKRMGAYFASLQGGPFASPRVSETLDWLRAQGVAGLGQSSWGPTGFAFFASEDEGEALLGRLLAEIKQPELVFALAQGRNEGAKVETSGGEIR